MSRGSQRNRYIPSRNCHADKYKDRGHGAISVASVIKQALDKNQMFGSIGGNWARYHPEADVAGGHRFPYRQRDLDPGRRELPVPVLVLVLGWFQPESIALGPDHGLGRPVVPQPA